PPQHLPVLRTALATLRLPAVRQWCVLYAVACGLLVAMALHLPTYLHLAYGRGWAEAALDTAVFVGVAAACRPLGGWLAQHHRPVPVLVAAYAPTGVLGVLLAFVPALPITTAALIAVGVALGTAGGVLLFLVGRAVPPDRAGLVTGVVGAAGGLGGLLPPLVLGVVYGIERSYAIGLMVLSGVALAATGYLRTRGEWRDRLAYPVPRPAPPVAEQLDLAGTATTV